MDDRPNFIHKQYFEEDPSSVQNYPKTNQKLYYSVQLLKFIPYITKKMDVISIIQL